MGQKTGGSASILQPFPFQTLSVVSAWRLSALVSDLFQTDRSCQTFDDFISLGRDPALCLYGSVCMAVSQERLTSSSGSVTTSILTGGGGAGCKKKRGSSCTLVFLYSSPLHPAMTPSDGGWGDSAFCCHWPLFQYPDRTIQHLIPSSLPRLPLLSTSPCINSENERLAFRQTV